MQSTENDCPVLHGVWRSQIYGLTEIVESGPMRKDIENQKPSNSSWEDIEYGQRFALSLLLKVSRGPIIGA